MAVPAPNRTPSATPTNYGIPPGLTGSSGGGTVTAVTGTPPINSSGGTAPDISVDTFDGTNPGVVPAGPNDASKFLDGTGNFTTPAGGGTVTAVTATGPLASSGGTTPDISLTLPSDATKYLDGTGAFTVPPGTTVIPAFPFGMFDGVDGEDAYPIPGAKGDPGATGSTGVDGRNGYTVFLDPDDPEMPMLIPGRDGTNGTNGADGAQGAMGPTIPVIETDDPEIYAGWNTLPHDATHQLDGSDSVLTPFSPAGSILIPSGYGWYVPGVLTIAAGQSLTIGATGVLETTGTGSPVSVDGATISTDESTNSATYVDLTTVGPSVTLTTGTTVLVWLSAQIYNLALGSVGVISVAVSGATTLAASDTNDVAWPSVVAGASASVSRGFKIGGLTPGSNTFTMKYRVTGATFHFLNRSIIVTALTTS